MDLFTGKIVGWRAGSRMTKELVIEALEQAYEREKPEAVYCTTQTVAANTHQRNTRTS
ncbi:hypothetical protein JZ785_03740 [Alicyclobacillus curvatus]|nr:hypothetical protein JZ785_03740 [Alicyclobacillus curvatus]